MGTILGRNTGLWLGLVAAILNTGVVVFGLKLDTEQLAAINALALAIVGVVANASDPTTAPLLAATTHAPTNGTVTPTGS